MTKGELVEALALWPDDAILEISVSTGADMKDPHYECEKTWFELAHVEVMSDSGVHCLLIAGKVTMA